MEAHVVGGGELAWESDLTKGVGAPVPPLLAFRSLHAVFLAHALESGRAGDAEASRTALEASWRLHQSVRDRPDSISQLMAVASAGMQHGVLRRLPNPPPGWRQRPVADYRQSMVRACQLDAWVITSQLRGMGIQDVAETEHGKPGSPGLSRRASRLLTSPYVELMAADYSDRLRVAAVELASMDPCRFDAGAYQSGLEASIPRWSGIARVALPGAARIWDALGRAGFDAELTQQVLEAKARRADGAPFLLALRPSRVCPSVRWVATEGENGVTIAAQREPFPAAAPYRNAERFTVAGAAAR